MEGRKDAEHFKTLDQPTKKETYILYSWHSPIIYNYSFVFI
ncbi:hypothetical protein CU029_0684 [Enterococcus faecium]|nr:hypothetical protein [Enterococcus faecium]MBK4808379.1 hypothetical protein [Enterococcus faecium]